MLAVWANVVSFEVSVVVVVVLVVVVPFVLAHTSGPAASPAAVFASGCSLLATPESMNYHS